MTPGLAGFIAAGDDPQTWDDVRRRGARRRWDRVRAAFPSAAAPRGARRRTWLDTFDWRLYKAGLTLEYAGRARRRRTAAVRRVAVRRRRPAGDRLAGVPPAPARDLPDGPVGDPRRRPRRAARAAPRRRPSPADRRVPAAERGRQDRRPAARRAPGGRRPPGHVRPLAAPADDHRGPRLPGQARRAARLIAGVPGVEPATQPLLADALRAVGRRPGDYSNKVDATSPAACPLPRRRRRSCCGCSTSSRRTCPACSATSTPSSCTTCGSRCAGRGALKLFGDALTAARPGPRERSSRCSPPSSSGSAT